MPHMGDVYHAVQPELAMRTVFIQPKTSSTRLRMRWLTA